MKQFIKYTLVAGLVLFLTNCNDSNDNAIDASSNNSASSKTLRRCATYEVLQQDLLKDPSLRLRMQTLGNKTLRVLANRSNAKLLSNGNVEIPVVVNVIYHKDTEKISTAQIQSQIDALNRDYSATNADYSKVPAEFASIKSSTSIRFVLSKIIRRYSSKESWPMDHTMKYTSQGGIDPTEPTKYLNIWVVSNIDDETLGFATFPGETDRSGVVIGSPYFGTMGTATAPYNLGRTATHEVGHWLGLHHIWGDGAFDVADCTDDDGIADTPIQSKAYQGTPVYPSISTCGAWNEMTMNYMDYVDDEAMYMFTAGQASFMRATINSSRPELLP